MNELPEIPWCNDAPAEDRYLVAVSGGADSIALLHLLWLRHFRNLVVVHLDHGLRGDASTEDAAFVACIAASLDLPFVTQRVAVAEMARAEGRSVELAARHARHRFFAETAESQGCATVLLGHHADDQAETLLFNLCRGSAGLKGMRVESEHRIAGKTLRFVRPLLHLRRRELRNFLHSRDLPFREDATNSEPFTPRNRLRTEAIPLLDAICGREVTPLLLRAAAAHSEQAEALESIADQASALDPQGRLHLPALRSLPPAVQRLLLHRFLADHRVPDVDQGLLDRSLLLVAGRGPAKINLPGNRFLRRRQQRGFVE